MKVRGQLHSPSALPLGVRDPRYPLHRRFGDPRGGLGGAAETEKSRVFSRNQTAGRQVHVVLTIPTEPSRTLYLWFSRDYRNKD